MKLRKWVAAAAAMIFAAALMSAVGFAVGSTPAQAAVASNFNPGQLISDQNFYNGNAMSAADVQSFLNSRVQNCSPGYTCLKDFRQTTASRAADKRCAAYNGASNETAAQILFKVGAACGISQKALIVLLEKEQGLVSATSPSDARYRIATGYACPDTAPCDAKYYGFQNQVYMAAWQFKVYQDSPNYFAHRIGNTSVRLHPNASCGATNVNIANAATAGLYNYTPYQPNAAALNNLYGTGDSCSSYGNRNFWRMYTDWFGDPNGGTPQPTGDFENPTPGQNSIYVEGWAYNPANDAPVYVWINVDGVGQPVLADRSIDWFPNSFPGFGPKHGFAVTIPATPGTKQVCVTNSTLGIQLSCKSVTVQPGTGQLETVTQVPGGVLVTGWAVNYNSTAPENVQISVNGNIKIARADIVRDDIANRFPGTGRQHGYRLLVEAPLGAQQVCASGIGGAMGCQNLTTTARDIGSFDSIAPAKGGFTVSGWAINMASTAASWVWVDVDGVGRAYGATANRSWFDTIYPGSGNAHGFDLTIAATPGPHTVCILGAATSASFGCKSVTVRDPRQESGSFDSLSATASGLALSGWSYAGDGTDSSWVWVTVNGVGSAYRAATTRSWFEGVFPGAGTQHGFDLSIPANPGTYNVCVQGASTGVSYGCRTATVAAPNTPTEVGSLDGVTVSSRAISITGWSHDFRSKNPSYVWVTVDGVGSALRAASVRSWFPLMFPGESVNHGFDQTIPATPGKHTVCVSGASTPVSYGCQVVTVPN
ncbi:hypothetical protein [Mycetocola sp. JXN-3]|uniref:hypothetical protein n=1 Tax=Mycetocola sp. JXN-3 TaxID=2116510 RepID=UPI00165D2529|nr:hypothetical protein [Mycetocola sp. JXN-3]